MTAMAAARRASKGTSGGHGKGAEPPGVGCVIIKGRVRLRSANDNALIHGGWKALWVARRDRSHARRVGLGAYGIVLKGGAGLRQTTRAETRGEVGCLSQWGIPCSGAAMLHESASQQGPFRAFVIQA